MSPSELDLPVMPSAEQLRRKVFATVRRGYDPDQVQRYLHDVAAQLEVLEKELRDAKMAASAKERMTPGEALAEQVAREDAAKASAETPEETADAYERLTARFGEMLRRADEEATKVLDEATAEAGRIMGEARGEADRIRLDAQARAEEARQAGREALEKAKREADATLGTLSERRETLVTQMQEMQTHLLAVAKDLEGAISERDAAIVQALEAPKSETPDAPTPAGDEILDPRYEDLWISKEPVDIPDLASIELDFDDDQGD
jgi:DivIVA domain-containing protein